MRVPVFLALVPALVLAARPAAADAPPAAASPPLGVMVSLGLSGGTYEGSMLDPWGAEASIGWRAFPQLAVLMRGAAVVLLHGEAYQEVQLGGRLWPATASKPSPRFYLELRGGHLEIDEEYDCQPSTQPGMSDCWGGATTGRSYGLQIGAAVARGEHASFDLFMAVDVLRWRDRTDDTQDSTSAVRFGLALTFF